LALVLRKELFPDPSFLNARIGNPGEIGPGPPVNAFGVTASGKFSSLHFGTREKPRLIADLDRRELFLNRTV
jgi:hypothetical protein